MKRLKLILFTLLISITTLYAQINFQTFENENMVEIIPKGQKKTLSDFAGTEGLQDIFAYSMGKYEVTQELYESVTGINPSYHKGEKLPVEEVTWYDAVYFCNELTKLTMGEENCCYTITDIKKDDNGNIEMARVTWNQNKKGYRLPTEAEWEYAARGGEKGGWDYTYSGSNKINKVAWNDNNSDDKTHNVGTKQANMAGLYDMSGNVWEWCWNIWKVDWPAHVDRGGGYGDINDYCSVSFRGDDYPNFRYRSLGFRVCRGL